ncbi:MAG: DUF89 family protein, partial [Thaumarchaeota archaeon]|nr:DUF89 family protein [Nitrososphaerota archaeon]
MAVKATEDEALRERAVGEVLKWLTENYSSKDLTPNLLHTYAYRIVQRITGNPDPFKHVKEQSNRLALEILPQVEAELEKKRDLAERFRFAALAAICGNSLDFEVEGHEVSLENLKTSLINCLGESLAVDDTPSLMKTLSKARKVIYLIDNAGEIAFDKPFIRLISESFGVKVLAAVKSGPVLNDATMEDAEAVGLGEVAEVIETGSSSIGLVLEECSSEFLEELRGADIVIAKGQGYYESITEIEDSIAKPLYYVLKAKCEAVARSIGVKKGDNVVKLARSKILKESRE